MNTHSFTISNAINTGWKFTKKYFWTLMLLWGIVYIPSLVSNLFSMIVNYIPGATEMVWNEMQNMEVAQPTWPRSIAIAIVFAIASFFGARLGLGLIKTSFIVLKDKKPTVKDLCVPFKYVLRLIGWGILVGLVTIIGFIALIIPGIYISIRLSMFKYFIAEWYGTIDAIKASWAITEGNVWNLIGISFVYFGIAVLWVLALFFGLLWALPTIMLAQAYVYTQLKHNLPHTIKPIN